MVIKDTTGKGSCDIYAFSPQKIILNITDHRRRSYDNGGKVTGTSKEYRKEYWKYMRMLCTCLVIITTSKSLLAWWVSGTFQHSSTLFSSLLQCWYVLKKYVTWSTTRLECQIVSIRVLCDHIREVLGALNAHTEYAGGKKRDKTTNTSVCLTIEMRSLCFILSVVIWYDFFTKRIIQGKFFRAPPLSLPYWKAN